MLAKAVKVGKEFILEQRTAASGRLGGAEHLVLVMRCDSEVDQTRNVPGGAL